MPRLWPMLQSRLQSLEQLNWLQMPYSYTLIQVCAHAVHA